MTITKDMAAVCMEVLNCAVWRKLNDLVRVIQRLRKEGFLPGQGVLFLARSFAGVMGFLGMATILLRAIKNGSDLGGTVGQAVAWMLVLALVGALVGAIAEWTVVDSVQSKIETELAATPATDKAVE